MMTKSTKILFQGKSKKGTDIVIRYPKMSNAKELWKFINTLSKERTFILYQGEKVSLKKETEWLEKTMQRMKKKEEVGLSVFIGKKIIGMSGVRMGNKIKSHIGNFGILIRKEYRGEGIGWLLMNEVMMEAKKNLKNLKIVTLDVFEANKIAQNLYKKMGFKKYGFLPEGLMYRGGYTGDISMYKKI